jgi:hypothetical protein
LRLVDPDGEEPLDYSVRIGIQSFYGVDFSGVQVHGGFFARGLISVLSFLFRGEVEGFTVGHQIFLSGKGWSNYNAIHGGDRGKALKGIELIAHELTHTAQSQQYGLTVLAVRYLYYLAKMGYEDNPFEVDATAQALRILDLLKENPDFLEPIMSGPAIQPSQVSIWQSPGVCCWSDARGMFGGLLGGWFQLSEFGGELWIDGVNLTGVLTMNGRH